MALQDMEQILARLRSESLDLTPIAQISDRIETMAAEELAKVKATDTGKQIAEAVRTWKTSCASARASEERQWYKNIDMYQGRQFSEFDSARNAMVEVPNLDYEPRISVNITEPICRTEIAKTGSQNPSATVMPASRDQQDISAALAAEQAWEWWYRDQRFQTNVFGPANQWRTVCGNSFIKTFQDWGRVDSAATEAAQRKYEQDLAQAQQQGIPIPPVPPEPVMGKLRAMPVDPFHLYVPDLAELNLQEQGYVLHVYTIPVEKAKLQYADFTPKDWQPTTVSADSILNSARIGIKGGNTAKADSVEVIEAWVKPGYSKLLPQGGLAILAGDELVALATDGIPYKHGDFPFAHLTGIETGRFYRKSIVQSITPLQNELNRIMAQIIKHKNLATKPMFFYDEGSTDPTRIRSKAGTFIPIRLGSRYPSAVPIQELPSFVSQLIADIRGYLEDISGQHQVSRAVSPGADTAASALAFLAETDDNFLSPTFDSIEAAMETVARQVLSGMVQFWDAPRFIRVVGDDGAFDAKMLSQSDLKNGTDIFVEHESMLPKSKSAKIATIEGWVDKGIILPEQALEAMEMGTLGNVYKRIRLDRDSARRENITLASTDPALVQQHYQQFQQQAQVASAEQGVMAAASGGAPVDPMMAAAPMQPPAFFPINWYDNDAVHIDEHKAYAKSQAYQTLDPALQKELEIHVNEHEQRLTQTMALQQQAAAVAPGGPADAAPQGAVGPSADYAGPQQLAA